MMNYEQNRIIQFRTLKLGCSPEKFFLALAQVIKRSYPEQLNLFIGIVMHEF